MDAHVGQVVWRLGYAHKILGVKSFYAARGSAVSEGGHDGSRNAPEAFPERAANARGIRVCEGVA